MTQTSRRQLLLNALWGGTALGASGAVWASANQREDGLAVAGAMRAEGGVGSDGRSGTRFELGISDESLTRRSLPGRGHGLAWSPSLRHLVMVARRPGQFLLVYQLGSDEPIYVLESEEDHHFFGHAVYSHDGQFLYTTEQNYELGTGLIGVRDTRKGYQKVAEFPSGGIGPHELVLGADGEQLIVANGGILTHPETGRTTLNPGELAPSLVVINRVSGEMIDKQTPSPELSQNSIRHLDCNANGQVVVVCQFQGARQQLVPLIARYDQANGLRWFDVPKRDLRQMKQYCGSVRFDVSGRLFAVSSPRGNRMLVGDWEGNRLVDHLEIQDVCGITAGQRAGEFILSNGRGELYQYRFDASNTSRQDDRLVPLSKDDNPGYAWDNHLISLS